MALQDDIFDVQAALKRRKSEAAAFERITSHLYAMEHSAESSDKVLKALAQGIRALRWIEKEMK